MLDKTLRHYLFFTTPPQVHMCYHMVICVTKS